jgi:lysophospholipase L1-like esterase
MLLLLALAGCEAPTALPPLAPDAVILAFGDSLTEGVGASRGQAYPAVLEALSGRRVVNAGVRGEESAAGLTRLPGVLERVGPDLVILGHGGNDILRRRDLARSASNLRGMVELARRNGAAVVMLGVPGFGLFLGTHPMYGQIAESLQVPLEGEALANILGDPALKSDAIHPNAEGYRRLAEAVHALLQERGAL